MDLCFFDSIAHINWDMDPVDRSFHHNKVSAYLSQLNSTHRPFIKELLQKTSYIPYDEFKDELLRTFNVFKENIPNEEFYLMLPHDKIGSEHWLTSIVWPHIRSMHIKQIIYDTSVIPFANTANILILDDAIYSGVNVLRQIDKFTSTNKKIPNIKFHLVIPFISACGKKFLSLHCKKLHVQYTLYGTRPLPMLSQLVDFPSYYPSPKKGKAYLQYLDTTLYDNLGIQSIDYPALYFDHKIAGSTSTFASIYSNGQLSPDKNFGPLFKTNPSRYKIEQLNSLYMEWRNRISVDN